MTSRPFLATALLLLVFAGAVPAAATVYVMATDGSLVDRSPVIVFGEIRSTQPAPAGGRAATDSLLQVEQVLKGEVSGDTIVVRQPGGIVADGVVSRLVGLPMLSPGDRVLLFLEPMDDVYGVVELALGMFFEVRAGGRLLLLREASLQAAVLPSGDETERELERARSLLPRDARAFVRWITGRVSGSDRPADYFESGLPDGPAAAVSAYRLLRTPAGCPAFNLPIRWRDFDRGGIVEFLFDAGGQSGLFGGGLSEIRIAAQAWNELPLSQVGTRVSVTESVPRSGEADGVNSITFGDPHNELPGSFGPGGGILAATWTFFDCTESAVHDIPGNESADAALIVEANMTTQDGYDLFLDASESPALAHAEVMGHEIGHALGIGHPCGDEPSGPCDEVTNEALMRAFAHDDGRGAALNSDDRAAVRFLYPIVAEPGPHTDCIPTTTSLVLSGHAVSVCYETEEGVVGEGMGGIWQSQAAGLLWFFDDGNAEVLLKVLDGCALNDHYWVFVAPATDLALNLYVTDGRGRRWSYRNRQGELAQPKGDTAAFACGPVQRAVQSSAVGETRYQYDDGTFESFSSKNGIAAQEYAQRFRLADHSILRYLEACFSRGPEDATRVLRFSVSAYRNRPGFFGNGEPGVLLGRLYDVARTLPAPGSHRCARVDLPPFQLGDDVWVSVYWRAGNTPTETKLLGEDRNGPGGTEVLTRAFVPGLSLMWQRAPGVRAFGIRIGVEKDPSPLPYYSKCEPTTALLVLDGGYEVSMCFETPDGVVGQAGSGVWQSEESGLLWFFDRENVEVLVKVLNGCAINGHRWVYVSPATDVAFNLRVTDGSGRVWRQRNRQGEAGRTEADTLAFPCDSV